MVLCAVTSAVVTATLLFSAFPAASVSDGQALSLAERPVGDAVQSIPEDARLNFRGLGPIHVGLTRREVEKVVGHRIPWQDKVTEGCATSTLAPGVWALFAKGKVASVSVTSDGIQGGVPPAYQTRAGLAVGTAQREIRAAYGSAAKRSPQRFVDGHYFKITKGNRRIVFATNAGVITTMTGGKRPEVDYVEGCA